MIEMIADVDIKMILYVIGAFFIFIFTGAALTIFQTVRGKGKLGFNLAGSYVCPVCSEKLPFKRKPVDIKQGLWGGWTCPRCDSRIDKWGKLEKESSKKD